jgi:hypothetical protein
VRWVPCHQGHGASSNCGWKKRHPQMQGCCEQSSSKQPTNEPGSSVSIVSGYGLDDRAMEVRPPGRGETVFPVTPVSRPAVRPIQPPVQWVSGVLSLGLKRGRSVTLITQSHLVPRSRKSTSISPLRQSAFVACSGVASRQPTKSGLQCWEP